MQSSGDRFRSCPMVILWPANLAIPQSLEKPAIVKTHQYSSPTPFRLSFSIPDPFPTFLCHFGQIEQNRELKNQHHSKAARPEADLVTHLCCLELCKPRCRVARTVFMSPRS